MELYVVIGMLVWIVESVAIAYRAAYSPTWKPDRATVLVMGGMLALVWPLTGTLRGLALLSAAGCWIANRHRGQEP